MNIEELEKCKIIHKLKNKPMLLRHKSTGEYYVYMKKMGNGYHKMTRENGGYTYIHNERMDRLKYASIQTAMEFTIGEYSLTDYLTYDLGSYD